MPAAGNAHARPEPHENVPARGAPARKTAEAPAGSTRPSPGAVDFENLLSLQASAGNQAVAALIERSKSLQRLPTAAAAAPPAAAPPAGSAGSDRQAILNKLHDDSKAAAREIRDILTGNRYLGSRNQAEIMAIVRQWATVPAAPNSNMTGMDWLIAGLRQNTYEVGWAVKQWTSAFDELYHRMDSDNVAELQKLVETSGKQFKNDKPIELAKFEVSQEDIIRGIKAGVELPAALASGGGSILLTIARWLVSTLPTLWNQVKAVLSLIDAIKGFRASGAGSRFTEPGLGALAVEGLFGEVGGLPVVGGPEPPKAEEGGGETSGLTKVLMMIVRGIGVVKTTYNKVATKVNGIIHSIDISKFEWLPNVAAVYAGIVQAKKLMENPFSAFETLTNKAKEMVGGFFDKITGHISEVASGIGEKLGMIVEPAKLMAHVADRLVSTVLNFIITHPPSALLETVFSVVQTAAGADLIDLVRKQLTPIGDKIIAKIANSDIVQGAIGPLKGPVHKIAEAIGKVTSKGMEIVKGVQAKVAAFLNPEHLKEMTGLGASIKPPVPVAEAAPPKDFLGAVKEGLHARLMVLGNARLIALAKSGAKFVWEKVKAGAKAAVGAVKGAILGRKKEFEAAGEHHELWAEDTEHGPALMMASKTVTLEEKLEEYQTAVREQNQKENELKELNFQLSRARQLHRSTGETKEEAAATADELEDIQKKVVGLVQQLEGLLVGKLKEEYHQDSRGRPILAASMLDRNAKGGRDMSAEQSVSRPLSQLMEYLQQQGGRWTARKEYSEGRPTYDAAHLIPHDFGGRPGTENLVPVESRVNKSFMGSEEGRIRSDLDNGEEYYAIVRCVYHDPPAELARPYRVPPRSGKSEDSELAPGTLVRFNLMALERVPDEVDFKVIKVKDKSIVYEKNYPTGGPIIDWVGKTRAELAEAGDTRGEEILDAESRKKLVEQAKTATP